MGTPPRGGNDDANDEEDDVAVPRGESTIAANDAATLEKDILAHPAPPGQVSVEGKRDPPSDSPDDDDDDVAVENNAPVGVGNVISQSMAEAEDSLMGGTSSTDRLPPNEDDDDDDDDGDDVSPDVETSVGEEAPNVMGGSARGDDVEVPGATDADTNEHAVLSEYQSQPTAYHRNQSSEGGKPTGNDDEAAAENGNDGNVVRAGSSDGNAGNGVGDPSVPPGGGIPDDSISPNQDQPEQPSVVENGGSDAPEGNPDGTIVPHQEDTPPENIAPEGNPDEIISPGRGGPAQPFVPINWDDGEEEESLFETIQSTVNVVLLAMSITSLLVFRKRVNDRLREDPSIGVSSAIKHETIDVAIRVITWARGKSGGSRGNGDAEIGSDALSGFGSSGISETIALSTATDEEWGWEDEEIGSRLELSAMGGNDAKGEDDDLAMAIAMSISETNNGGDVAMGAAASSVHRPMNPSNNMNGSKYSPSTSKDKALQPSSISNYTSTSYETPSYSTTGGDSIADLLGQMGGTGGSVIKSFGQKPVMKTNPKPQPKEESADDIFAEMGLSTSYRPTAASRPPIPAPKHVAWKDSSRTQSKANAPKSAKLSSLLDDAFDGDVDADTWGDDGDLDDLLD
jgi:hypothetical protein